jgi:hypothetical protein
MQNSIRIPYWELTKIPNVKLSASDEELELRNHVAEEKKKSLSTNSKKKVRCQITYKIFILCLGAINL